MGKRRGGCLTRTYKSPRAFDNEPFVYQGHELLVYQGSSGVSQFFNVSTCQSTCQSTRTGGLLLFHALLQARRCEGHHAEPPARAHLIGWSISPINNEHENIISTTNHRSSAASRSISPIKTTIIIIIVWCDWGMRPSIIISTTDYLYHHIINSSTNHRPSASRSISPINTYHHHHHHHRLVRWPLVLIDHHQHHQSSISSSASS